MEKLAESPTLVEEETPTPPTLSVSSGNDVIAGNKAQSFLMVPDSASDRIILFDPTDGSLIDDNFIDGSDETGLGIFETPINAIQVNDQIWVSDQVADAIFNFDLSGNFLGIVNDADGDGTPEGLDNIRGMEFAEGLVYVSNAGTDNGAPEDGTVVVVFDSAGNNLGFFDTGDPYDIRAYNRTLLISDIDEDNIDRYTLDGVNSTFIETFVDSDGETGINFPQQITVRESNANVLVGGFSFPGGVYEYDAEGNQVNFFNAEDGFADRLRAAYELGNGNIIWSGGDGVIVTNTTTGEDIDIYTVNTLDFRPSARYIEQLIVPNQDELDLTGAVFLGDQRLDKIFLNQDLNGDGDANDPLEVSVYFDETNASGFRDPIPTGNVFTIFQSNDGPVFYGDGDTDSVYRLLDLNGNGNALDEGEATLWFTDSESTPLPTPNGIAQGSDGAIYIVNAGVSSRPDDLVYRTLDLNGDGDALDEGESSVWLDLQTLNPSSSAFDIEFIGDVAFISDTVGGDDDVIYRAEDLDGSGTIEPNEANIFIQDGNEFDVDVDFGIAVDDENIYTWQSSNVIGPQPQSVHRLRDRNGSNDIDVANEAFEVWNIDALPSGFNSANGFSIALGPSRELVVTFNGSGDSENNLVRLVDQNGDGDYFDSGETIPYLAESVTGTIPERARAVEYAQTVETSTGPTISVSAENTTLVEDEGSVTKVIFDLDRPAPEGGLRISFSNLTDKEPLRDVDLFQSKFVNISNFVPFLPGGGTSGLNGGTFTIDEGATQAVLNLAIFDDHDLPTYDQNWTQENDIGVETQVWTIEPQAADNAEVPDVLIDEYSVNPNARSVLFTAADTRGQLNAPVAGDDKDVTDENTVLEVAAPGVLDNDIDADGDALTVNAVNGETSNVGTEITLDSGALLTVNADGSYSYNPNGQFDDLNDGETRTDSFEYTVTDSQFATQDFLNVDTAIVTIIIEGVDGEAPTESINITTTQASSETVDEVDEALYSFEWTGQIARFSVEGHFSYDQNQIGTDGIVNTEELSSLEVLFFSPDGTLLRTYTDNHLDEGVNFNFDPQTEEILQDGVFTEPDGFNIGDGSRSDGLTFWSKPFEEAVPHLHVDDWQDEFGIPPGFDPHEDVAFFTRTTQELIDTGRVGETYLDDLQDSLDEVGQRIEVIPVPTLRISAEPTILIEDEGTATLVTISLDQPAPEEGLVVSLSNKTDQRPLGDFDVFPPPPQAEFTNASLVQRFAGNDGLTLRIEGGATEATISLPIFDDDDLPTYDPDWNVNNDIGVETQVWTIEPQVAKNEGVPVDDYLVDPSARSVLFTLADTPGQLNAPVAADDTGTISEDTVLDVAAPGVLGNDTDADGDSLTVNAVNGEAANVGTEITLDSGALLTVNADGSYSYNSNGQFDDLDAGETATDRFEYTVTDSQFATQDFLNQDTATVTITIEGVEDESSFVPDFGTIDGDIIEVEGSNQLVFAGASDDLVDASIASEGGNRIYLGSGDDIGVLGQGDRYSGATGDDRFFTTTGGGNVITGGKDADQFWIAVAEIPTAVFEIPASDSYYTYADSVSPNSDRRLLADKANVIGFPDRQTISFLQFDLTGLPVDEIPSDVIGAEMKLEHDSDLAPTLISATDERPVSLSTYRLTAPYDPVNGNVDDIDYGVNGANAISTTLVGDDGVYNWDLTDLVDELTNSSASKVELALSGVFGNVNTDGRNSYASFYPASATDGLEPTLVIETEAINVITDFTSGEDVIGIAGFGIGFEDVDLTQVGDDALVGTGGINFALLENVDINDLSASDFAFG